MVEITIAELKEAEIERVAKKMREAYAEHEDLKHLLSWDMADEEKREAWRACARAAIREIKGDA